LMRNPAPMARRRSAVLSCDELRDLLAMEFFGL
jgi:hypothetical protein